jgi:hypothetical protein
MKALADFVYDSIITAERTDFGKGPVHEAATVWPLCRNKGEADHLQTRDAKLAADAKAAEVKAAHEARLAAAKRPKPRSVIGEVAGKIIERIIEGPAAESAPISIPDNRPFVVGESRLGESQLGEQPPRPRPALVRERSSPTRPNSLPRDVLDEIDRIDHEYRVG